MAIDPYNPRLLQNLGLTMRHYEVCLQVKQSPSEDWSFATFHIPAVCADDAVNIIKEQLHRDKLITQQVMYAAPLTHLKHPGHPMLQ